MTGATRYAILAAACTAFLFTALYAQASFERKAMRDNKWGDYASAKDGDENSFEWFKDLLARAKWDGSNQACLDHRRDIAKDFIVPDNVSGAQACSGPRTSLPGTPEMARRSVSGPIGSLCSSGNTAPTTRC